MPGKDEKQTFKFENDESLDAVIAQLEIIMRGLKARHLRIGSDDEQIEIRLPEVVELEIEAETRANKGSLEIEIKWDAS